jgi:hypothetical protein
MFTSFRASAISEFGHGENEVILTLQPHQTYSVFKP